MLFFVAASRTALLMETLVKKTQKQKKLTSTRTISRPTTPESTPYDLLEPVEEKVIRMHYGLSENDEKALEYAVGASEDTRMRVSLMEAGNIDALDADVPVCEGANQDDLRQLVKGQSKL